MPRRKPDNQTPAKRPTVRNATAADRERRAIEMRMAGSTFQQIADALGFADPSSAHKAVTRGLVETVRPAADELRELEAARLDRLLAAVWDKALAGELKAVESARKILADRARLLGLNLPVKADVTVTTRSETDAALQDLVAELDRRAAGQPAAPVGE